MEPAVTMRSEFTRHALRGLDVEWFAVDRRGCIAMLTSGYGAIPKAVFESEERYHRLAEFFAGRPEASGAKLAERLSAAGGHENFLADARRGLFSYSHTSYRALDPYELIALPLTPAPVGALPAEIQALLRPFRFDRLEFATAERVLAQEHFDCDV
jgi:hypothetical protein